MNIFKGQNLLEFSDRFKSDEDCKEYLSGIKWNDGFECYKCGHKKYQVRKDFSRTFFSINNIFVIILNFYICSISNKTAFPCTPFTSLKYFPSKSNSFPDLDSLT